jgi:hypothetical protein
MRQVDCRGPRDVAAVDHAGRRGRPVSQGRIAGVNGGRTMHTCIFCSHVLVMRLVSVLCTNTKPPLGFTRAQYLPKNSSRLPEQCST